MTDTSKSLESWIWDAACSIRGAKDAAKYKDFTNQACASITPHDESTVSSQFLYCWFEHQYEYLRQLGHGANQRNMNAALIRGFPLAFPKHDEQVEIVTALTSLDSKREIHQRKHAALTSLFRTLLHQLMTAKIRVHTLVIPELNPIP